MHGLHNGCIGQYGIIFREQLLGYPPKSTPIFFLKMDPPNQWHQTDLLADQDVLAILSKVGIRNPSDKDGTGGQTCMQKGWPSGAPKILFIVRQPDWMWVYLGIRYQEHILYEKSC